METEDQSSEKKTRKRRVKVPLEEQLPKQDNQPYDRTVKGMIVEDAAEMVPEFVEDAIFISSENVELDQAILKADVVLKLLRRQKEALFNLEAQSGPDPEMLYRVLQYVAALFKRYQLSIICLILYLFRCKAMKLPPVIDWGDGKTWEFKIICLWELDPEPFVAQQKLAFYPWLPAMNNPSVPLLFQSLDTMAKAYNRHQLGRRLTWFSYFLRRTDTVSESDKLIVQEKITMVLTYEEVIQEDPIIQKLLAQREFEGRLQGKAEADDRAKREAEIEIARAKAEAEIEVARAKADLQETIFDILSIRFSPALATRAQPAVKAIKSSDGLRQLHRQLLRAPNEEIALFVLDLPNEPASLSTPSEQVRLMPSDESLQAASSSAEKGQAISQTSALPDEHAPASLPDSSNGQSTPESANE